ncbi:hypothetical protein BGZ97_002091 [Linnemannia gamsii]|uniref:Uncharacterized protein n=1 Tax=Linnemannia gamsii TaxID=64522 RepID=A0A9P6R031_9FUNG|nr:hypothetical protein BGZ97_002091 [Linnemannia gamsii]
MATLFSIFESTPSDVLREALITSNGDLDQAISWILASTSKPTPSTSSLSKPVKKKQKLIQPRLSAFMPTPSSLSIFKPGISPASNHQQSGSTNSANNNNSVETLSSKDTSSSLPSLNDRLRWKDPPPTDTPTLSSDSTTTPSSSTTTFAKLKPPKPLILYNPEDIAKHCPCTLIFNVLDKDLANRLLKAMLIDSETWNRNRWWLFERMVESPHKTSYFAERDDDMEEVAGWTYNGKKQDPPRRFLPEMEEAKLVVRRIVNQLRKERDIHPYEVQGDWNCNVAAVNHYAHSKESVGFHADKLTYLGPRPTIGSLTLGVTRFFRIRKVIPDAKHPDTAGQLISIALPHNKGFSPQDTPICKCGVAMVLRCVFKNKANYGRYFYMCYAAGSKMGQTCGQFNWVDMEQKLGLVPSPGATVITGDGGADCEKTASESIQSPDIPKHNDDRQESDLNLAEELQEHDATLPEQQWEAIDDTGGLNLE